MLCTRPQWDFANSLDDASKECALSHTLCLFTGKDCPSAQKLATFTQYVVNFTIRLNCYLASQKYIPVRRGMAIIRFRVYVLRGTVMYGFSAP